MSRCETFEDQIEQNFQNIKNGSLIFAWDFDPHDTPFIVVAKKENDKIYAKIKETNSGAIVFDCYRKQSGTVREFVEKIAQFASAVRLLESKAYEEESRLVKAVYAMGKIDAIEDMMREIKKLAKEYGAEVEE